VTRTEPPDTATLVPTSVPIVYSPRAAEQQILKRTEQQIHRVQATCLPDTIKSERIHDYFCQCARDLERLAHHRLRVVYLRPARGGRR
jgi:hypothetical protein